MSERWLVKNKLCSLAKDTVRIELAPQIIELDCTHANLSNKVTAAHYQAGANDAYGKIIVPGKGKKMSCVDWRAKHVPHLWKVYTKQETGEIDAKTDKIALDKHDKPIQRFIKVAEFENKNKALTHARGLI